jgi:hypothetical protein
VTLEGELENGRLRLAHVVSPVLREVDGVVQGSGDGTTLRAAGRDLVAYGGGAFILRADADQTPVRVKGWTFAGEDKIVVVAVAATTTKRAKLKKNVGFLTAQMPVFAGLVGKGKQVWLSAFTGDTWGGYYLYDRDAYVPRGAVEIRRRSGGSQGLTSLGQ